MFNPVELEIELFCRGMRIDAPAGRRITRTRAGLGSGLEIVIEATPKNIWVNVPVVERFAQHSPFLLRCGADVPSASADESQAGGLPHTLLDTRSGVEYRVSIPPEPSWYSRKTSSGREMSRIGVLQGNYLGIYISARCLYWSKELDSACKFCTTGKNVGTVEEARKPVQDVVEVARAAHNESGSIFTHFNTGYHFEEQQDREWMHGLRMCEPYVRAVRDEIGGFIGVQAVPVLRQNYHEYDELIAAGTDHFSFCYEFEDPQWFARLCPGKAATLGQTAFFEAMEYTATKLGRGRVSGEIIAGVEPIAATKRGIDRIVNAGAFPTVCIFRPTIGSEMEDWAPPDPESMREVFVHLHEACRKAGLPVGVLPIEVSLVVQPEEAAGLVTPRFADHAYRLKNWTMRQLAKPYVAWKCSSADA